jgi:hypothetical protein
MTDDTFLEHIARESADEKRQQDRPAPVTLKARIYTALVRAQQKDGPLESLTLTKSAGRQLCVFEELVNIAPVGAAANSTFQCTACHARILAEHLENPPIWWPHCPYAGFKKP